MERYQLTDEIGSRGDVKVFEGLDVLLNRRVRVEVARSADRAIHARLAEHARLLAALCHPGIVKLYDARFGDRLSYVVMELVGGRPVDELLRGPEPDVAGSARFGCEVAEALAHAHSCGIAHRAVGARRVLVEPPSGRARLVGFHDAAHGGAAQQAADVRALGLLLARSVAPGPACPAALDHPAAQEPPPLPASLPEAWRRLLAAMTAREPGRRPAAAGTARAQGHAGGQREGVARRGRAAGGARPGQAARKPCRPAGERCSPAGPRPRRPTGPRPGAWPGALSSGPACLLDSGGRGRALTHCRRSGCLLSPPGPGSTGRRRPRPAFRAG